MARLLFIENREKTYFWAAIARGLIEAGHEIAWLVQNPLFARDLPGRVHLIPFPGPAELRADLDLAAFPALSTDRGRQYFGAGSAHYAYYAARIEAVFEAERPDLVIGESTLFHELLAIDLCERRNIPFTYPGADRYPAGRFTMYAYATQKALIESGETMDAAAALDLAKRIRDRSTVPEYMVRGARMPRLGPKLRWAATRLRVLAGRWRGERYNTPSAARKLELNRAAKANLQAWAQATAIPSAPDRTLLFPLQQQPENTIDVWGRPHCDQVALIERILAAAPADVTVALKANPRPYYEMSDALLALAKREPRIILLPLDWTMREAIAHTTGALTITGTIGYEAVCGAGRCLSLAHPVLDQDFPEFTAPSVEAAVRRLLDDPQAGRGTPETGAHLIQRLYARSFPGVINDPVSDPLVMRPENIATVAHSLDGALTRLGMGAAASSASPEPAAA